MTALVEAADPDPVGRLFEFGLEDLEMVGVNVPAVQRSLLRAPEHPDDHISCLTVAALIDPGDRYRMTQPLWVWDLETNSERLVLYPQVVDVSWSYLVDHLAVGGGGYALDENEPVWRRFPSLPGRRRSIELWAYEDFDLQAVEGFRVWDLWPLAEGDAEVIEANVEMWLEGDVALMREVAALDCGDWDVCDFAVHYGAGDTDEHDHRGRDGEQVEPGRYDYDTCRTGEDAVVQALEQNTIPFDDGSRYWKAFPGPRLPGSLTDTWERLCASSQRNAKAALTAFPPWDRDEIIRTERFYSPWLWS